MFEEDIESSGKVKNDWNLVDETTEHDDLPLPEIDFLTFIFSLNSSALVQLGILNDPVSAEKSINLLLAKHTIDTISMLQEKTQGNLNKEESEMLSGILYDLKILYIKQSK